MLARVGLGIAFAITVLSQVLPATAGETARASAHQGYAGWQRTASMRRSRIAGRQHT